MTLDNLFAGVICTAFYMPYLIMQRKIILELRGLRRWVASMPLPLFILYGLGPITLDLSRMQSWDLMSVIYVFGLVTALISAAWCAVLHALFLPSLKQAGPDAG